MLCYQHTAETVIVATVIVIIATDATAGFAATFGVKTVVANMSATVAAVVARMLQQWVTVLVAAVSTVIAANIVATFAR